METLDNVDEGDFTRGFLYKLVADLKNLDKSTVKESLEKDEKLFDEIITTLVQNKEIEVRNDLVLVRRGGAKLDVNLQRLSHTKSRSQSFSSTNFVDQDVILHLENVKKMSDLTFIFSLNAYNLPYCDSSKFRGIYQWFFSSFLHEVHSRTFESPNYKLLQESIMVVSVVSEHCVDLLECLFETINMVRTKLREVEINSSSESEMAISPRSPRRHFDDTLLEHLERCFYDPNKVFDFFRSRKLMKSLGERKDDTWLSKFDNYKEAILEVIPVHRSICEAFISSIQNLRSVRGGKQPLSPEAAAFCNDVVIYIDSYISFLDFFGPRGLGRRTLLLGKEALIQLESENIKSPKIVRKRNSPRETQLGATTWTRLSSLVVGKKTPK